MVKLVEDFGFRRVRVTGSHHIFIRPEVPELVNLQEEALREVERARAAWIEAAKEAGKPVPPPRYRPAIYQVGR